MMEGCDNLDDNEDSNGVTMQKNFCTSDSYTR